MKRTLALILCLLLLTGCGKPAAAETTQPETTVPETTQPETTQPETTQLPETEAPSTETVDAVVVAQADPVITGQQNTVHVATVDEFLNAIAPDTEIVVDAALLDLSQAANYGKSGGKYYPLGGPLRRAGADFAGPQQFHHPGFRPGADRWGHQRRTQICGRFDL